MPERRTFVIMSVSIVYSRATIGRTGIVILVNVVLLVRQDATDNQSPRVIIKTWVDNTLIDT